MSNTAPCAICGLPVVGWTMADTDEHGRVVHSIDKCIYLLKAESERLRAELARLKAAARPVIQWRSGCRGTTYAISKLRAAVEGDRDE